MAIRRTVTLTVTLSAASTGTVTVKYATGGGTAIAGTDYTSTSGMLTFSAGQTSKTFTVTIRGDTVKEPNETFNVTLSSPAGAVIFRGTGVVTIVDDEAALTAARAAPAGRRSGPRSCNPPLRRQRRRGWCCGRARTSPG